MRLARADALDAMVDGAHPGRQPEPFGCVASDGRVEDHGGRDDARMSQEFLHLRAFVGDARDGAEFTAGNGRWYADLTHSRRVHGGRRADGAVGALDRAQRVHCIRGADVVGKAHLHGLGAVRDRAAADGDDEIGSDRTRLFRGPEHRRAGRVRRHAIPDGGAAVAESRLHLGNLVGVAVESAGHHQERARGAEPSRLLCDSLGGGLAEHHSIHGPEIDASRCWHVIQSSMSRSVTSAPIIGRLIADSKGGPAPWRGCGKLIADLLQRAVYHMPSAAAVSPFAEDAGSCWRDRPWRTPSVVIRQYPAWPAPNICLPDPKSQPRWPPAAVYGASWPERGSQHGARHACLSLVF